MVYFAANGLATSDLFPCKWSLHVIFFAANGRCKWSLQVVLLQESSFCCKFPILLQVTRWKWPAVSGKAVSGYKVAASGSAASGFAANSLNLGYSYKLGRCKWICCKCPYTGQNLLSKKRLPKWILSLDINLGAAGWDQMVQNPLELAITLL